MNLEPFTALGPWIGVLLTLMAYTYLVKENPLFRFAEYTFIATATANAVVLGLKSLDSLVITPLIKQQFIIFIPTLLGLLIYTRFIKQYSYISRWPIALLTGVGTGLLMRGLIDSQFVQQIISTINISLSANNLVPSINSVILAVGTVLSLSYFLFTVQQKGISTISGRIGRIFLMITFGATFASLAMTRFSLFISRMQEVVRLIMGV